MLSAQTVSSFQAPVSLLSQAAFDDEFRAQLQQDPAAALAARGIRIDSQDLPQTVTLPSKMECSRFIGEADIDKGWLGFFA